MIGSGWVRCVWVRYGRGGREAPLHLTFSFSFRGSSACCSASFFQPDLIERAKDVPTGTGAGQTLFAGARSERTFGFCYFCSFRHFNHSLYKTMIGLLLSSVISMKRSVAASQVR